MAGGYEFLPPSDIKAERPSAELVRALVRAYAELDYDLVYLAPDEARLIQDSGLDLPPGWITAGPRPQTLTIERGGLRVGLLLFPFLDPSLDAAPAVLASQVADKAARLREQTDLVVGVSLWGGMAEKRFLAKAGPVVDVLLGSGPGPGLAAALLDKDRVFWTRPYAKGRSVNALGLAAVPGRENGWRWLREDNLHLLYKPLGDDVPNDPAMNALFAGFPAKKKP